MWGPERAGGAPWGAEGGAEVEEVLLEVRASSAASDQLEELDSWRLLRVVGTVIDLLMGQTAAAPPPTPPTSQPPVIKGVNERPSYWASAGCVGQMLVSSWEAGLEGWTRTCLP